MKLLPIALCIFAIAASNTQCNKPKYQAENLPTHQFRWGIGGGITGNVVTHVLLENGQVFKMESIQGNKIVPVDVSRRKGRDAFDIIMKSGMGNIDNISLDAPGNIYYFYETILDGVSHRITWGDPKTPVHDNIRDTYARLQRLIQESGR